MNLDRLAWITLNRVLGAGSAVVHRLVTLAGSPAKVFSLKPKNKSEKTNLAIKSEVMTLLARLPWQDIAQEELSRCDKLSGYIITLADEDYPGLLRQIDMPPPVLYIKGKLKANSLRKLGVVGSRKPSVYGITAVRDLVKGLVSQGFTIISGLARGIDAQAHSITLEEQGITWAVLAHGIDQLYPRENKRIYEKIIANQGAIVSEFPIGVAPLRHHFPQRNRIISGLTQGILVIEAGVKSGALITARWAGEQGREIFALPGPYKAALSQGTHALIKDGAKLVTKLSDILEEFKLNTLASESSLPAISQLNLAYNPVLEALTEGGLHVDQIADKCKNSSSGVLVELLSLELKGLVKQAPGQIYYRV